MLRQGGKKPSYARLFNLINTNSLVGCYAFEPLNEDSPVKNEFLSLEADPRVLYKEGALDLAKLIAKELDKSIAKVEEVHGKEFTKKVTVHICNTAECFSKYTGNHPLIAAAVSENGLFLAPLAFKAGHHKGFLTHELSHLHLFQQISLIQTHYIPQWFHDGLATFAANGGGGHNVTKSQALDYIKANKNIVAVDSAGMFGKGGTFSNRWPLNYDASEDNKFQQNMNYRQSSMFVAYLSKGSKIQKVLRSIEAGDSFKESFKKLMVVVRVTYG